MSDAKGFFQSVSETPPELTGIALGAILVVGAAALGALIYPFVTSVDAGEVVIKDCGGDLTVWRHPKDDGIRWDGFCSTETYRARAGASVKERMPGADVDVTMRAVVLADLPHDDDAMRALHEAYGSEDAFLAKAVMPPVMEDIRAAVADPAWHEPKGNIVERKLKGAIEYGMKRVSPVGRIWSSEEAKRALAADIQRRIGARTFPTGVSVKVELGFVTE